MRSSERLEITSGLEEGELERRFAELSSPRGAKAEVIRRAIEGLAGDFRLADLASTRPTHSGLRSA